MRTPTGLQRHDSFLIRLNNTNCRLATIYITEHIHLGHHLTTVDGFLQNGYQLHGQAPESYKQILLECEHETLGEGGYLRVYNQVK